MKGILYLLLTLPLAAGPFQDMSLDSDSKLGDTERVGGKKERTVHVKAKATIAKISQTPAAFVGKPRIPISPGKLYGFKRWKSGWQARHAGITVYLSKEAKTYYESSTKEGATPILTGDVREDDSGKPAVYLYESAVKR